MNYLALAHGAGLAKPVDDVHAAGNERGMLTNFPLG